MKGSQNWQELRDSVRDLEAERDRLRSGYGESERLSGAVSEPFWRRKARLVDSRAEIDILRDQLRQLKATLKRYRLKIDLKYFTIMT